MVWYGSVEDIKEPVAEPAPVSTLRSLHLSSCVPAPGKCIGIGGKARELAFLATQSIEPPRYYGLKYSRAYLRFLYFTLLVFVSILSWSEEPKATRALSVSSATRVTVNSYRAIKAEPEPRLPRFFADHEKRKSVS
ncbi:hypothetical protein KQX54_003411 [Cotesia glomerata]|uniref:Uncharacterized protein n=1 Tax=Cotesia glomerata TaxID=32391 RepID=A0AAV7IIN1_COTGL|nr:hypothetical protein KQX54_003411 [Cotesia glomerata]